MHAMVKHLTIWETDEVMMEEITNLSRVRDGDRERGGCESGGVDR
jgi:hypothetical protein